MGHVFRLFFQIPAAKHSIPGGFGLICRKNLDPFPVQKIPGGTGKLIPFCKVKDPFAILVPQIFPDILLI
jgi:hypothetical protein